MRVEALLRRASRTTQLSQTPIEIGKLSIDPRSSRSGRWKPAPFPSRRRRPISSFLLACNAGRVYTREEIIAEIWGPNTWHVNADTLPRIFAIFEKKSKRILRNRNTSETVGGDGYRREIRRTAQRFRSRLSGLLSAGRYPHVSRMYGPALRRERAR